LKPGGMLLSFAGTRTHHRIASAIEDAGFEIMDMIAWMYGSGFPKSLNIGKAVDKLQGNEREVVGIDKNAERFKEYKEQDGCERKTFNDKITKGTSEWEGWGTALKPAFEPITVARKPLSEKTVAENVLKWGTGGINIDECRVGTEENLGRFNQAKEDTVFKLGFQKNNDGSLIDNSNGLGRFPANLIHEGSEEVLKCFPETAKGSDKKRNRTVLGSFGMPNDTTPEYADSGNASRFFYCAKASKSERNYGCENLEIKKGGGLNATVCGDSRTGNITLQQNNHPTVKPLKLLEYLVKLVSKKNAIILDPFIGSGSTAVACVKLQRQFIGFEMEKEYCDIANARINKAREQTKFEDVLRVVKGETK